MSAVGPTEEKIARHLQEAIDSLRDDIARVELWADALGCFSQPVPEYDPAECQLNKYMLPKAAAKPDGGAERAHHRRFPVKDSA